MNLQNQPPGVSLAAGLCNGRILPDLPHAIGVPDLAYNIDKKASLNLPTSSIFPSKY